MAPGMKGALSSPVIDERGESLAFLAMAEDGYESDLNTIHVIRNPRAITKADVMNGLEGFVSVVEAGVRDFSPSQLAVSAPFKAFLPCLINSGRTLVKDCTLSPKYTAEPRSIIRPLAGFRWNVSTISTVPLHPSLTPSMVFSSPPALCAIPRESTLLARPSLTRRLSTSSLKSSGSKAPPGK